MTIHIIIEQNYNWLNHKPWRSVNEDEIIPKEAGKDKKQTQQEHEEEMANYSAFAFVFYPSPLYFPAKSAFLCHQTKNKNKNKTKLGEFLPKTSHLRL